MTTTYHVDKPLVWLAGEIKTPPFAASARIEAGILLRRLQQGELLHLPHSRPMPSLGRRCHELRVPNETSAWRIMYRLDPDAVVIAAVFAKKTQLTPRQMLVSCRRRLQLYDQTLIEY